MSHTLCPLQKGQIVSIQQPTIHRWDTTGQVPNHQYHVRVDRSGRITLRNRQFLKKLETPTIPFPILSAMPETSTPNLTPHKPNTPGLQTMDTGITSSHLTSILLSRLQNLPGHCSDYFHTTSQVWRNSSLPKDHYLRVMGRGDVEW